MALGTLAGATWAWNLFDGLNRTKGAKDSHVFLFRGKPVRSIQNGFKKGCRDCGIKNFRFHDLRHTLVTNMRKSGVDQGTIMKISGHKTLAMFQRYNTIDRGDAKDAVGKLEKFLELKRVER